MKNARNSLFHTNVSAVVAVEEDVQGRCLLGFVCAALHAIFSQLYLLGNHACFLANSSVACVGKIKQL